MIIDWIKGVTRRLYYENSRDIKCLLLPLHVSLKIWKGSSCRTITVLTLNLDLLKTILTLSCNNWFIDVCLWNGKRKWLLKYSFSTETQKLIEEIYTPCNFVIIKLVFIQKVLLSKRQKRGSENKVKKKKRMTSWSNLFF